MKLHSGNSFFVIGAMSGTSLDGLDLAAVEFSLSNNKWKFSVIEAETLKYPKEWEEKLRSAHNLPGEHLMKLHSDYGRFIGQQANRFIKKHKLSPKLIASHGHTIFHQPENGFTFQAGNGASIAAETGITTISDFRTTDVALGGQGAPLVPVGDRLLFSEYESCLNLGGFANVSFEQNKKRIAFDICPVNIVLNYYAGKLGFEFDADGDLGKRGKVNDELLGKLNQLGFYEKNPPKSLGREWVENSFLPLTESFGISVEDKLRTIYEHISMQIGGTAPESGKILVTGGGAFNSFLIERIRTHAKCSIELPSAQIINFKEAIIFAFLGLLRFRNEINCYASVTGAKKESSSGVIFVGEQD